MNNDHKKAFIILIWLLNNFLEYHGCQCHQHLTILLGVLAAIIIILSTVVWLVCNHIAEELKNWLCEFNFWNWQLTVYWYWCKYYNGQTKSIHVLWFIIFCICFVLFCLALFMINCHLHENKILYIYRRFLSLEFIRTSTVYMSCVDW